MKVVNSIPEKEIFRFGEGEWNEHIKGDWNCPECWKEMYDLFPCKCSECGGIKHAHFGDEMEDGYYLEYKCEQCGDTSYEDGYTKPEEYKTYKIALDAATNKQSK
jgi:ribosomal protein L37E